MKINALIDILVLTFLAAYAPVVQTYAEPVAVQSHSELVAQPVAAVAGTETQTQTSSCAAPAPAAIAKCQEMAASILAATVRLEMMVYAPGQDGDGYRYEDGSIGHATVMDGRYLVTHNHFGLSLQDVEEGRLSKLSIYRATGEIILKDAPFGAFDVVVVDPQTLVFDFGDYGGQGLFATIGLASAEFLSWDSVQLQPGMEVAQIDWDGQTAYVDWVRVTAVQVEGETPQVVLEKFVEQGASGGGVFYEGVHVANNWFRSTDRQADTGEVLRQYSVAALNSGAAANVR